MPSDAELREWAADHLAYEIWMLRCLIDRLGGVAIASSGGEEMDQVTVNAYVESFALHARGIIDFLWSDRRRPDDAVAGDYVHNWPEIRSERPEVLDDVAPRAGKEIAHLTYGRLRVAEDAKRWRNGEIWMAIRDALVVLFREAPEDRIPPALKAKVRVYLT